MEGSLGHEIEVGEPMNRFRFPVFVCTLALSLTAAPDPYKELKFRLVGPFRGGRVVAVAGVPSQPLVYYFGGAGGGTFKTADGGGHWGPINDGPPQNGSGGADPGSRHPPHLVSGR